MDGTAAIQAAYQETDRAYRVSESKAGCVVALVLVPAGITLDYFVYPEHLATFMVLRLLCDVVIGAILALHFTEFGRRHIPMITLLWLSAVQVTICFMIFATDGYNSTYYAGLNLCVLAVGILLPTSVPEAVIFCVITLVLYLAACLAHSGGVVELAVLYNNLYFLTLTGIISTTAVLFNTRRRFTEFRLSYELDSRNKQLAELDRLKSQFFANISHELRTPLTLILAPVQDLLQGSYRLPDTIAERLGIVRDNALRLLKLVNDLLDVIRLEEGKTQLERKPLRIATLLGGVVDAMANLAEAREVSLHKAIHAGEAMVYGDQHALEKVFFNLLSNALKFTPAGGSITVRARLYGTDIHISVEDTGIGIHSQELPYIFDRFRQADSSTTRRYPGTGLGLALARELAEHHGGRIRVASQQGQGTTVTVELPLAPEDSGEVELLTMDASRHDPLDTLYLAAERSAGLPPQAADLAEPDAGGARTSVLVVDDEPDMRRYLVETLRPEFAVTQAADGLLGLSLARRLKPDLMVLDLMLPELDGLEVCRQLKNDPDTRDIKIILLTARVDEAAKLNALENGADDFLTKPFSSTEVKTRLRNLHQTSGLQRDLKSRNQALEQTLEQLKRTQQQLIQSEKLNALGSLAAGLLHEVNNPLNFSLTALQLVRRDAARLQDPDLEEMLADIDQGMQRIRRIVSDLRAFAYPSEADHRPFPLTEAVASAIHFTAHEHRGVTVENQLDSDIRVHGSQPHVVQVLINLITNAVKATQCAGRPGLVRIHGQARDSRYRLAVWDNGVGMDETTRARVFDPFFTTRDVGQGLGLGLSICHTIVANHGGSLVVDSGPGQWTEFSFDLPLADATAGASA